MALEIVVSCDQVKLFTKPGCMLWFHVLEPNL